MKYHETYSGNLNRMAGQAVLQPNLLSSWAEHGVRIRRKWVLGVPQIIRNFDHFFRIETHGLTWVLPF